MKVINSLIIFCFTTFILTSSGICLPSSGSSSSKISKINFADGIDIRALVQTQIDSARARNLRGEIKSYINFVSIKSNVIPSIQNHIDVETKPLFNFHANTKLLIILGFSIITFFIVFIRRIKNKSQNLSGTKSKENIELIKEEYNVKEDDPELNLIRSGLVDQTAGEISSNSVSSKAKGLRIAKGEIILAAKIKSYQLAHLSSHK